MIEVYSIHVRKNDAFPDRKTILKLDSFLTLHHISHTVELMGDYGCIIHFREKMPSLLAVCIIFKYLVEDVFDPDIYLVNSDHWLIHKKEVIPVNEKLGSLTPESLAAFIKTMEEISE